ncbi:MAG: transcriptional regulator [Lachnospiraceae bacterium]|jgi:DNA-binding MarR family transcriptional regulator|nr:transcriptional regulator [Lachnospiraceae bacterium]
MNYDKLKLDRQLCFPLYVTSKELIKNYKPLLDPLGITYTQYITFMALWEEDNITVKELGQKLYLDSGTLTPLLKKMELQGFITRERSTTDERTVYIKLTVKGLELRDKAAHIPDKMVACLPVSMEEALALQKLLQNYLKNMEH